MKRSGKAGLVPVFPPGWGMAGGPEFVTKCNVQPRYDEVMMSQPDSRIQTTRPESKTAAKKPYVKPEVRHERVFETMALNCGKVQSTTHSCRVNRRSS